MKAVDLPVSDASPPDAAAIRGDATREALIVTAIEVFGRQGFHAASTRQIAQEAGVNQALIGYHFRNKDGLYLAAFEFMSARIGERLAPAVQAIEAELDRPAPADPLNLLFRLTDAMVWLMTGMESAPWARLIIREQQAPTPAFDIIYERMMRPKATLMARLVRLLDPEGARGDTRLLVATIFGQILAFRTARAAITRFLEWDSVGEAEVAAIRAQVRRNLTALFAGAGGPP